ncbi:Dynamin-1-like protein [Phytophthora pseudosyringae]|uniref:Dynamin-1-like protein n=1 Tax=Phytophthora pseudosyringae TaxID=221518 RepID=A0A8T1WEP8_9STRA|nr:Dynamin-1-like protein [Phytophthora pseudosyringae]
MDQLIPIINKLQDVFSAIGQSPINLPQIVVIGSQSSGKSSVLENIVGKDFLPRGSGIVTRRPLVLQLYNSSATAPAEDGAAEDGAEEWGEFLHIPGQKFTDFDEIRREIEKETDRITGKNKGISNKSINLKVFSPHVLNLTLVDLPGITKVPVGDQPVNIEEQIRDMCTEFISNPNSIILAVTSANTDLANSDALKMAREIDPEGQRTIGVLTKLDLMDDGTDAMEMLQGRVIPLKRGFVGVVNRSQADINAKLAIRDSLTKEQNFFKTHPAYRAIAARMGTQYLSKTLNTILMHHIRDCLPDIKSKIGSMITDMDQELGEMGSPTEQMTPTQMGGCLLNLLSHFSSNFTNSLDGRNHQLVEMDELYGGARINYIFNEIFSKSLREVNPFDGLSDEDIRTTIRNANGPRQSLFVPEVSFELLAKRQIGRLEQPGLQCVDLVFDELQRVTSQCETIELTRFPELRDRVMEVVNGMLRASLVPTQAMIQNLIQIELAYVNTNHPDFIGGSRAVAQLMEKMQRETMASAGTPNNNMINQDPRRAGQVPKQNAVPAGHAGATEEKQDGNGLMSFFGGGRKKSGADTPTSAKPAVVKLPQVPVSMRQGDDPTDRERIETEIIKSLLASYFDIVRKNFLDLVPKAIMCFMVGHSKENIQNELVSSLYREDKLTELLAETGDIAARRSNCDEMRTLLQRALEIVNEVRDFNTFK